MLVLYDLTLMTVCFGVLHCCRPHLLHKDQIKDFHHQTGLVELTELNHLFVHASKPPPVCNAVQLPPSRCQWNTALLLPYTLCYTERIGSHCLKPQFAVCPGTTPQDS